MGSCRRGTGRGWTQPAHTSAWHCPTDSRTGEMERMDDDDDDDDDD